MKPKLVKRHISSVHTKITRPREYRTLVESHHNDIVVMIIKRKVLIYGHYLNDAA